MRFRLRTPVPRTISALAIVVAGLVYKTQGADIRMPGTQAPSEEVPGPGCWPKTTEECTIGTADFHEVYHNEKIFCCPSPSSCALHSGKDRRDDCCKTKHCGAATPGCLPLVSFEQDPTLTNLCKIAIGRKSNSLPPCPPSNEPCAFPHFWGMIWNDHCSRYPVEPGPVERVCSWIQLHCRKGRGWTDDPEDPPVKNLTLPCEESQLCFGLGRATQADQPCNCGDCLASVAQVCPNDPRDSSLIMVASLSDERDSTCNCVCKKGLEKCPFPQERSETTCGCECPASSLKERQRCERDRLKHDLIWDDELCVCKCNPSIEALLGANQVMDSTTCAVSCAPKLIEECRLKSKLPSENCDGCGECDTNLPSCPEPQQRGDNCKCQCPREDVAICTRRGGVIDEKSCECKCASTCDNPLQMHSEESCSVCKCRPESRSACLSAAFLVFNEETCKYSCDSTKNCPGAQVNTPLSNGNPCECACMCPSKKECKKRNEYFDEELCDCVLPECHPSMKRNEETGACECDASKTSQFCTEGQVLLPSEEKCVCGCPPELNEALKSKKSPVDWLIDTSSCSIVCSENVESCGAKQEGTMERKVENECACSCTESATEECAARGGQIGEHCECEVCIPLDKASKFEYVNGARVATGCKMQCKANPLCNGKGSEQDPNTCECRCSQEAVETCVSLKKGVPLPPACDTCGKCIAPPFCSHDKSLSASCNCECKSAKELGCADPSLPVTQDSDGACKCGCPPVSEHFLEILDPFTSCEPVCKRHIDSCSGLLTGTVKPGSLDSKCECSCDQRKCDGTPQSKAMWVDSGNKALGCKCECPTPPQDCPQNLVWSAGECACICPPGSCLCGQGMRNMEETCRQKGMVYSSDPSTGFCSCVCSEQEKSICKSKYGDKVTAVLNREATACQCECDLTMLERANCPAGQVRTDVRGCPGGDPQFMRSECDSSHACECACSAGSFEKLVASGVAASNAELDPNDPTCSKAVCPTSEVVKFKSMLSPKHPNLIFDEAPNKCNLYCKAGCSKGRQLDQWCDCKCPASSPVCPAHQYLSHDCKKCICLDKCPFPGMIQDQVSCQCKCSSLPTCNSVLHKTVFIPGEGCSCQCRRQTTCGANQIFDPQSCSCTCDPRLPRKQGDFVLRQLKQKSVWQNGVSTSCEYVCDVNSRKASHCADKESFMPAADGGSKCECQCTHQMCSTVTQGIMDYRNRNRLETISLVTGRDATGQCGCVCPADYAKAPCANPSQTRSELNCACQCKNAEAETRKCQARGMFFDPTSCSCSCSGCPGKQELLDPNICDSCHCPITSLASQVSFMGQEWTEFALANTELYSATGRSCSWQCSAASTVHCTRRGEMQYEFPHCGCEPAPRPPEPKPKPKPALRKSKCHGKWTCEGSRRGSQQCSSFKHTQWYICPSVAGGCMGVCRCLEPGLKGYQILPATGYHQQHCRAVHEDLSRYVRL